MSATLPEKIKKELIESFQKGINKEASEIKFDQAYPLFTHTTGISTSQTSIEAPDQLKKKFKVYLMLTIINLQNRAIPAWMCVKKLTIK